MTTSTETDANDVGDNDNDREPFGRNDLVRIGVILVAGIVTGLVWRPEAFEPRRVGAASTTSRLASLYSKPIELMPLDRVRELFSLGDVAIIDARPRSTYMKGHIPGSFSITAKTGETLVPNLRRLLSRDIPVVIVGRDERDVSARTVAAQVRLYADLPQIEVLEGGIAAWKAVGLPIITGWDMDDVVEASR